MTKGPYYKIGEVAESLGVGLATVKQYVAKGLLNPVVVNENSNRKHYRFSVAEVNRFRRSLYQVEPVAPVQTVSDTPPGFLTMLQMQTKTGMSVGGVYGRIKQGRIERVKLGGRTYFREVEQPVLPLVDAPYRLTPSEGIGRLLADVKLIKVQGEKIEVLEVQVGELREKFAAIVNALGGL